MPTMKKLQSDCGMFHLFELKKHNQTNDNALTQTTKRVTGDDV